MMAALPIWAVELAPRMSVRKYIVPATCYRKAHRGLNVLIRMPRPRHSSLYVLTAFLGDYILEKR
jgi:hypothetical protein